MKKVSNKDVVMKFGLTVMKMGSSNRSDGVSKKFMKNVCEEKNT